MDQAVREAQDAGMRDADNLKAQIAELQGHLNKVLMDNARLEHDYTRQNKRQKTATALAGAMYTLMQNPAMMEQLSSSPFMQGITQLASSNHLSGGLIGNVDYIPVLPSSADSSQPPPSLSMEVFRKENSK